MTLFNFFKDLLYGEAPIVDDSLLIGGHKNSNTQRVLTKNINDLISGYKYLKIGKSGDADIRADQKDYRGNYSKMYLLYQSTSKSYVQHYEAYYIDRFYKQIQNVAKGSGGG
jgi:hypothetical protein